MGYSFDVYSIPSFFALGLILFLTYILLKKRVMEHKKLDRETRIFAVLLMAIFFWTLGDVMFYAAPDERSMILWAKISNAGLVVIPTALLHFTLTYPSEKEWFSKRKDLFLSAMYGLALGWVVLVLTTMQFIAGANAETRNMEVGVFAFLFVFIYFPIIMLFASSQINKSRKEVENQDVQRQAKFMLLGLLSTLFFLLIFIPFITPALRIPAHAADAFSGFLLALLFAVAAFKYNLMDLEIILEKSIAYSSISIIIAAIFVVVGEILEGVFVSIIGWKGSDIPGIMSALVVAFTIDPVKTKVEKAADRIFPETDAFKKS